MVRYWNTVLDFDRISTTNRSRASGELLTIDDAAENSELMCSALTTGHKIRALWLAGILFSNFRGPYDPYRLEYPK